jgi:hypothetical protein
MAPDLQCAATGLPAWKRGQSGQVGNEAALTVVTSAGVRLVTRCATKPRASAVHADWRNAMTAWLRRVRSSASSLSASSIAPGRLLSA